MITCNCPTPTRLLQTQTPPEDGQFLVWSGSDQDWVPYTPTPELPPAESGQYPVYDGVEWRAVDVPSLADWCDPFPQTTMIPMLDIVDGEWKFIQSNINAHEVGEIRLQTDGVNVHSGDLWVDGVIALVNGDGLAAPRATITVSGDCELPQLFRERTLHLKHLDSVTCEQSGATNIDIFPQPLDGISVANVRFFRQTNTSGDAKIVIFKGDNTGTVNAVISGNGNSYVNAAAGVFSIGTNSTGGLASGDCYVSGTLSAGALVDRTPMPTLADAKRALLTMRRNPDYEQQMAWYDVALALHRQRKANADDVEIFERDNPLPERPSELDYAALDQVLKSKTGHRNLSATVSALVLVVQDLTAEIERLTTAKTTRK